MSYLWRLITLPSGIAQQSLRNVLLVFFSTLLLAAELPVLPAGTWECHGKVQLRGQSSAENFWMRLLPPDPNFGGNRMLQIVYTPPPPSAVGGTILGDAPFLLLDANARIVAWNDRAGLSQVTPGASGEATYAVTRDRTPNEHTTVTTEVRKVSGERGWDRSIALLLAAISWREDAHMHLPCFDFYGDEATALVSWTGRKLNLAEQSFTIETDPSGRFKHVLSTSGTPVLTVTKWLQEGR